MRFQFTGLIRGPTIYRQGYYMMWTISIHRPHTRPDADYFSQTPRPKQFQFTGLIRGPTLASKSASSALSIFQFTGLIRGPTNLRLDAAGQPANFNSQASYEARHGRAGIKWACSDFNSQASYEARPRRNPSPISPSVFQFTGLIRGPTPYGHITQPSRLFQFTGLIRGPTFFLPKLLDILFISIHRPHTRPDPITTVTFAAILPFQFTGLIRGPT